VPSSVASVKDSADLAKRFYSTRSPIRDATKNAPVPVFREQALSRRPRGNYGPLTHVNTTFSETGVIAGCPWLLSLSNCATLPLLWQKSLASSIALWI
jgi:hypothetical protein